MLDRQTETMLQVASLLTAEDLDMLRGTQMAAVCEIPPEKPIPAETTGTAAAEPGGESPDGSPTGVAESRGEYERARTRESKVSTACMGREREKHDWWPAGTELVGQIGSEMFTATVVENSQVKSGRSVKITTGAAAGRVCITPTRAAIEATESYRKANNLGRGGGITNGWAFWKPKA